MINSFIDIGCGPGDMVKMGLKLGFDSIGIEGDRNCKTNRVIIHDFTKSHAIFEYFYY